MNVEHLLKRRAEVIARHEVLESVSGSGYHEGDEQAREMARKKQLPLSKRPVVIQHDGRNWIVGPDVQVVRSVLAEWVDEQDYRQSAHEKAAEAAGIEPSPLSPQKMQAMRASHQVAAGTGDVIELPNSEFNSILLGLNESDVQVVAAGVLP